MKYLTSSVFMMMSSTVFASGALREKVSCSNDRVTELAYLVTLSGPADGDAITEGHLKETRSDTPDLTTSLSCNGALGMSSAQGDEVVTLASCESARFSQGYKVDLMKGGAGLLSAKIMKVRFDGTKTSTVLPCHTIATSHADEQHGAGSRLATSAIDEIRYVIHGYGCGSTQAEAALDAYLDAKDHCARREGRLGTLISSFDENNCRDASFSCYVPR